MSHATAVPAPDLSDAQLRAIEALVSGVSQAKAAASAGVTTRTLQRWCKQATFAEALQITRTAVWSEVTGLLQQGALRSAKTLVLALDAPEWRVRMAASRQLLSLAGQAAKTELALYRLAHQAPAEQPAVPAQAVAAPPVPAQPVATTPPASEAVTGEEPSKGRQNATRAPAPGAALRESGRRSPLCGPLLAERHAAAWRRGQAAIGGAGCASPPVTGAPA